jgi:NADH:ubiquinone oxidoreductase subunit 5 (subunit L)/multisubunit Na+/H+ antiporter MnhA subunit
MENVGIILIGIGAALIGKSNSNEILALCGMTGALLHTMNHSFFKSMLFFGAGNIYASTHSTSCDTFGGLAKSMPVTAILFLLATVAICALPPLNGFVSEFTIYLGLLDGISSGGEVLSSASGLIGLSLIGGLAVLTFSKLFGTVFLGAPRTHEVVEAQEADTFSLGACAIPAAGILFVGLCPIPVFKVIAKIAAPFVPLSDRGLEWINDHALGGAMQGVMITAWLLVVIIVALYLLKRRAQRNREVRTGATWGCGFTQTTPQMQYTGESFSEGLQSIASSLTKDTGKGEAVDKNEIFPSAHEFEVKHRDKVSRLMNEWWAALLGQINRRVMRLRTGNISRDVSYALIFMLLVALLSIFNLI